MTISNIASAINAAHAGVDAAKREGARYAIEAGRLLIEAKETVGHGDWVEWIRKHCTFSPRTAQIYIKLFNKVGTDQAKAQRVSHLSLREAVRETEQPKGRFSRSPTPPAAPAMDGDHPATASQVLVMLIVRFGGLPGLMKLLHALDAGCSPKSIGQDIRSLVAGRSSDEVMTWDRTIREVFDNANATEVKKVIFSAWSDAA